MALSGSKRLILVLCIAVFAISHATPLTSPGAPAQSQDTGPTMERSHAEVHFPQGIQFSLTASLDEPPKRVDLLYRAADDPTLHLAHTEMRVIDNRLTVDETLDLRANYLPPGIQIVYFWRFHSANGTWVDSPSQSTLWHDTRYSWRSKSTEQVTVHVHDLSDSFGQEILDSAQRTVDSLETLYDLTLGLPISIWVYAHASALTSAQQANSREAIAGVAFSEYSVINAAVPEGNTTELGRVIPHEVSHLVLHQAANNPYALPPLWLDEGLAVYYQSGGKENFHRAVKRSLDANTLFSLEALGASFPLNSEESYLAYAQSLSAVTFILQRFGDDGMARLLAAISEGNAIEAAMRTALLIDLADFDRDWKAWLTTVDHGATNNQVAVPWVINREAA